MASSSPFNYVDAPFVPSIVCVECGNNAHCIRRQPDRNGLPLEHQAFECMEYHRRSYRTAGMVPSDAAIQQAAEQITGKTQADRKGVSRNK